MNDLYFHPAKPDGGVFALPKMLNIIGVKTHPAPDSLTSFEEPVMLWRGDTKIEPEVTPKRGINFGCVDISKEQVARVFLEVFGYSLDVDPREFKGRMVEKSDENAAHDGAVLEGPIEAPKPGRVYQVLVDNEVSEGVIEDIRTPIIGDRIPFVYRKHRPTTTRFANRNTEVAIAATVRVFSEDERAKLKLFSRKMGMDYGELDVLRDKASGKIYVVDANRTPVGPPNGTTKEDYYRVLRLMGTAFQHEFLFDHYFKKAEQA